eukprot:g4225.t1
MLRKRALTQLHNARDMFTLEVNRWTSYLNLLRSTYMGLDGSFLYPKQVPPRHRLFEGAALHETWKPVSDQSIGGESTCDIHLVDTIIENDDSKKEEDNDYSGEHRFSKVEENLHRPSTHASFQGTTRSITGSSSDAEEYTQPGFCSIHSPRYVPEEDLEGFEGLSLMVRTCGRPYIMNLRFATALPQDDLFQAFLITPPNEWVKLEVPFEDLVLTFGGRPKAVQRKLRFNEDRVALESMNFTIADHKEGKFQLDIAYIDLVKEVTIRTKPPGLDEKIREAQAFLDQEDSEGKGTDVRSLLS